MTADSVYKDDSYPNFSNCIADLVKSDTLFTYVFAPNLNSYCCPHTGNNNPTGSGYWFQIKFATPVVVESVFIFNREDGDPEVPMRIVGSDLYVGNSAFVH